MANVNDDAVVIRVKALSHKNVAVVITVKNRLYPDVFNG